MQNTDDAAGQDDARESRRIVDHHDVEGIAVIGSGRWHEAPVMGIGQSGEERF
jgi:fructose-1,6-bisphosphatase/sedoheptulose 1,7-bisphosphatase-like protein